MRMNWLLVTLIYLFLVSVSDYLSFPFIVKSKSYVIFLISAIFPDNLLLLNLIFMLLNSLQSSFKYLQSFHCLA